MPLVQNCTHKNHVLINKMYVKEKVYARVSAHHGEKLRTIPPYEFCSTDIRTDTTLGQQPYTQIPPHFGERLYVQGQRQAPPHFGEKLCLQGLRLALKTKALIKPIGYARTRSTQLKIHTRKYHHTLNRNVTYNFQAFVKRIHAQVPSHTSQQLSTEVPHFGKRL